MAGVRADFLTVFQRNNTFDVATALFNDDNIGGNTGSTESDASYDSLFIARTGLDNYFYDGLTRTVLPNEVTITTSLADPTIGLYADVRAAGVIESEFDNLRIVSAVPEPSSIAIFAMGSIGFFVRRRRS